MTKTKNGQSRATLMPISKHCGKKRPIARAVATVKTRPYVKFRYDQMR